jgi:hypothetical protein
MMLDMGEERTPTQHIDNLIDSHTAMQLANKVLPGLVSLVIGGTIAFPIINDYRTPRAIVLNYTDVSDSSQRFKASIEAYCQQLIETLKEGDYLIAAKFADRVNLESSSFFESRNSTQLHGECDRATAKPKGVGINPGTDLVAATAHLAAQVSMTRVRGQNLVVRASILIDAAEPLNGSRSTAKQELIRSIGIITDKGGKLAIVGSETGLQQELIQQLATQPNVKICPWNNARSCAIDWLNSR